MPQSHLFIYQYRGNYSKAAHLLFCHMGAFSMDFLLVFWLLVELHGSGLLEISKINEGI